MAKKKNRNIQIINNINDLINEVNYSDFEYKSYFEHICNLIPNVEKERIQSYNCGKTEYRIAGTNSTTNYFILQSLLKINKIVKVYAYFPDKKEYKIFGEFGCDSFPPAKKVERKILSDFIKKHKLKPIANTQK